MRLSSLLRFDLTVGLWRRGMWAKYLVWAAFLTLASLECSVRLRALELGPGTWGDYLLCLFGGMEPPRGLFQAPFLWLLLHLGILFFTLPYLRDDLGDLGQQLLLRAGNRTAWWLSKCLWNAAAVVLFYLIAWAAVFLWASLRGAAWTLAVSPALPGLLAAGLPQAAGSPWDMALELTLLPLLVTLSLSLTQMLLCLILRPTLSYVVSIVVMNVSAYCPSPLLLGNYAMALRSSKVMEHGVSLGAGLLLTAALIILSAALFRKTDILQKED